MPSGRLQATSSPPLVGRGPDVLHSHEDELPEMLGERPALAAFWIESSVWPDPRMNSWSAVGGLGPAEHPKAERKLFDEREAPAQLASSRATRRHRDQKAVPLLDRAGGRRVTWTSAERQRAAEQRGRRQRSDRSSRHRQPLPDLQQTARHDRAQVERGGHRRPRSRHLDRQLHGTHVERVRAGPQRRQAKPRAISARRERATGTV